MLKQESCAIAKMSAQCTIRQDAHGLKLESPFVPFKILLLRPPALLSH